MNTPNDNTPDLKQMESLMVQRKTNNQTKYRENRVTANLKKIRSIVFLQKINKFARHASAILYSFLFLIKFANVETKNVESNNVGKK